MKPVYERGGTQKNIYEIDEVEEINCLNCGSNKKNKLHVEFGSIGIVKCIKCNLVYTSPRPKNSEKNYHGNFKSYEKEFDYIFKGILTHHRDINYNQEISIIKKHKPAGKLLDVGTTAGRFLHLTIKSFKFVKGQYM